MNFVNNWIRPLELTASATSAALDLPDGDYLLTAARGDEYEIIAATVTGGMAELVRGYEGTEAQDWAAGSAIYCGLTAATIAGLFLAIAELTGRVEALESAPSAQEFNIQMTVGVAPADPGPEGSMGYLPFISVGSCAPDAIDIAGLGLTQIASIARFPGEGEQHYITLALAGRLDKGAVSLTVPGIGKLEGAGAANYYRSSEMEPPESLWDWAVDSAAWAENDVVELTITITL